MTDNKRKNEKIIIPESLPVLIKNDMVIYPLLILPAAVAEQNFIKLIDDALATPSKMVLVAYTKEQDISKISKESVEEYATVANILKMLRFPDGTVRILLQGIKRARISDLNVIDAKPYFNAKFETIEETDGSSIKEEAMVRNLKTLFKQYVKYSQQIPDEIFQIIDTIQESWKLADFIASNLPVETEIRYEILTLKSPMKRMEILTGIINKEISILEMGEKIKLKVSNEINEDQKKYFLREQMKAIRRELGEDDPKEKEMQELRQRADSKNLPEEAREVLDREIERIDMMNPMMPEYSVSRTYIEWILDLPWGDYSDDKLDIKRAEKVLNEDHYDLEKVKTRILEYLAVRKLKSDSKGPILCFVGPPGVGKTSLGKSIARALGRNFIRISLGGIRDEAEIRGHRRTYVGALPGRIIQEMKKAKSGNPVFMLDEIDKIGMDFRGDPASALLEVLDPEQNDSFADHYLEIEYDLSQVMFITTANVLYSIPGPLLDRMEVIDLPGYTIEDKLYIAKRYLVPRQIEENGLKKSMVKFNDPAIREVIDGYTREAGVRNLERTIGNICRKIAKDIVSGKKKKYSITDKNVSKFLGKRKFLSDKAEKKAGVGIATGMAWTPMGGVILFVEAILMPGKGNFMLTGQLGDVMKESARAALSYIKANHKKYNIELEKFDKNDIHIHLPEGAIPKDGPSAGITMALAIVSALSGTPIRNDIAMTGEISLRGKVLPIGGVKEKVIGAKLAGINEIILPAENRRDLDDIPAKTKKGMKFHFVKTLDNVLKLALTETGRKK